VTTRVMLVSHEATRTGAPRVAVEIAAGLQRAPDHDLTVLLRWPGPLSPELGANASRILLEPLRRVRAALRMLVPNWGFVNRFEEFIAFCVLRRFRPDVAYLNTVKSACYARAALRLNIPVILHVHELEPLASSTLARYHLDGLYPQIHLVACSTAVRVNLARVTRVAPAEIAVIPSVPDADRVLRLADQAHSRPSRDGRALVVGACARADERKGIDLWLEAVRLVVNDDRSRQTRFVWVGSYDDDTVRLVQRYGLADHVEFLGETDNPYPAIAAMDVFTLASREDPFPLVVIEAMVLGRAIAAFDVGGVAEQLGSAGVLVPACDTRRLANAITALLDDQHRRQQLGSAAAARARDEYSIEKFRGSVVSVAGQTARTDIGPALFRFDPPETPPSQTAVLLTWFDPADQQSGVSRDPWRLPYCADSITTTGFRLELSERHRRSPWTKLPLHPIVRLLERATAPFLQTLLARREIGRADLAIAMFESQGNALCALRRLKIRPFTRPLFAVITCWLARDLSHFGHVRRTLYRQVYQSVDVLFCFSSNQTEILVRELGLAPKRVVSVPFGVDHRYFSPRPDAERGYVLSVGRDAGRDWETLLEAIRDTSLDVRIASRPRAFAHLDLPANVEFLGYVDRERYRSLLAGASVVVVSTRDLAYPSGQTVALEAMAMGRCCVVTDTAPMREYVRDGQNALLVPPGDASALRAAVIRAMADTAMRRRIGEAARLSIEREFNAPRMWQRIAEVLASRAHPVPTGQPDRFDPSVTR
jgi:glycosyltransferase involved in cell wall biosynthesis